MNKLREIMRAPARVDMLEACLRDEKWRVAEQEKRMEELARRMTVLEDALTPAAPGEEQEKLAKQWDCFWAYDGTEQEGRGFE